MGQDVSSAYFYIVRQGEEGYAPEVYGKIPLSFSKAKVDWTLNQNHLGVAQN